jgi:cytochrome c oxidase subunit 1
VTGAIFALIAATYFWLPKWTGNMYDEKLGKLHFWLSAISINITFFPQHFLGLAGMPRRIPDYALQFTEFNTISSIGSFVFGVSQLLFVYIIFRTIRGGEKATAEVWEGAKGTGLEWTLSSPPPFHSFSTAPDDKTLVAAGMLK